MLTIHRVARALQTVLTDTADTLARSTGFLKRQRKFTGSRFVQMLVFGLLDDPDASLAQLAQTAAAAGLVVSRQSVEERFTPQAVALDLASGGLRGPELQAGRTPDSKAPLAVAPLPAGSLRLADLGYFDLKAM